MKKALVALVAGLALALAGLWAAYSYLDVAVRIALERFGPDVVGASVDVDSVQLSPRDGRGRIGSLEIGNPPGFAAPLAARVGEIRLALDPGTLTSAVVVVREIAVESLLVTYERGDRGTNLDAIQKRIEAYAGGSREAAGKPSSGAADSGTRRRFVIERLSIRNARVLVTNRGLRGQGLTFDLPDVELRDVGKRQNGVTASQAAAIVASTVQQRIAVRVLTNVEALRRGGLEGAVDALRGLLK